MSNNKKYKQRIGSRAQVMHETVKMTSGGLIKKQLKYNKYGKIVSIKASNAAKKSKNLIKAGYIAKKGHFKVFKNKNKYLQKAGMNGTNDNKLFSNIVPMKRSKHKRGLINRKMKNINQLFKNNNETEKYIFVIQKLLINKDDIALSNGITNLYNFLIHLKELHIDIYVQDIFTTKHGSFTLFKNLMNNQLPDNNNTIFNIFCSTVLPRYIPQNNHNYTYTYDIPFDVYYKRVSTWLIHYQRYGYTTIVLFGLNGGHWSVIHNIQQIERKYYVSLVDHIYLYTELKHLLYLVWKKKNGSGYLCTFKSNNSGIKKSPNTQLKLDFSKFSDNYLFKRSNNKDTGDSKYDFNKDSFLTSSYTGQQTRQDTIFFNNMCFLDTMQYVLIKCNPELFKQQLLKIKTILTNYKTNIGKYKHLLKSAVKSSAELSATPNAELSAESSAAPNAELSAEPNAESSEKLVISNELLNRYSMILYLSIYLRVIFIKYTDVNKRKRYRLECDIFTNLISTLNLYGIINNPPVERERGRRAEGHRVLGNKGRVRGNMGRGMKRQWRK